MKTKAAAAISCGGKKPAVRGTLASFIVGRFEGEGVICSRGGVLLKIKIELETEKPIDLASKLLDKRGRSVPEDLEST